MQSKFSCPRGTTDITPFDISRWDNIERISKQILTCYNYKEIRTPLFEETELFARSMGQSSDVVCKQMLNLAAQQKDDQDGVTLSGLSLRPENTASVVRSYIQNGFDRKEPISKLFYIGPMFRGERPQKGRLRQFNQIGVEVLGPNTAQPYLDAEIISLSVHLLKSLGLEKFQLKINTLGTPEDKENFSQMLRQALKPYRKELSEYSQQRFERNVLRVLDSKDAADQEIVKKVHIGLSYLSTESQHYYAQVKEALMNLDVDFVEDQHLVRGLDYYTHTVFEICGSSLGSQDALGAGGRYNNLVRQLGGGDIDAMGFALGVERILLALGDKEVPLSNPLAAYIVPMSEEALNQGFVLMNVLRQENISCDLSYKYSAKLKNVLSNANKMDVHTVILLGEEEMKKQCVTLKDMKQKKEETISIKGNDFSKIINILKERYN